MKPKDPIMLSLFFQHYLEQNSLKRPCNDLIMQMKDLITITQFLSNRVVPTMKTIKQTIKQQQKNFKKFNDSTKTTISQIGNQPEYKFSYFLESSYQQQRSFNFINQTGKDFIEKTIAQKQFKLKFMESQNMPDDFIFHKPVKKFRKSATSTQEKDYTWYSYFNTKLNMYEVVTRRYRILVGMKVQNQNYRWVIERIQQKLNRQIIPYFKKYFEQKLIPALANRFQDSTQQNILACINHFSYFLEILQINRYLCHITSSNFFSDKVKLEYNGRKYQFTFNKLQLFQQPIITITQQENSEIVLKLRFDKKNIKGILIIDQYIILENSQYRYQNPFVLLSHFQSLIEYGTRLKKYMQVLNKSPEEIIQYLFIKLNANFWTFDQSKQIAKNQNFNVQQDGIYLGRVQSKKLITIQIKQNGLFHSKISYIFLNNLARLMAKFEHVFYVVFIICQILLENRQKQCQLDFYQIYNLQRGQNQKIHLIFRKKVCIEDLMIKNITSKTANLQQQISFNSIKFLAEISMNFKNLSFYHFKDTDTKFIYEKQQWKQWFKQTQRTESQYLDPLRVIQILKYMQNNVIFKYVVERKLRNDSKLIYNIKI